MLIYLHIHAFVYLCVCIGSHIPTCAYICIFFHFTCFVEIVVHLYVKLINSTKMNLRWIGTGA
jgi:hypothetical protein